MRRFDEDDAKSLNAAEWQLDLLKANPDYVSWGPHEDYMWTKDDDQSWKSRQVFNTWADFGPWKLDELNECVNFYFSVNRESVECSTCGGDGYHPDAAGVVSTFYAHMNRAGEHWNDKITQDEVQALVDGGRLMDWTHTFKAGEGWTRNDPPTIPTAAEVNAEQKGGGFFRSHDAINRSILIRTRLKRMGIPVTCPTCEGHGYVHTAPAAHVSLTLWWLHPRKGCSRGIEVTNIDQADLLAVQQFLRYAAQRNAQRFGLIDFITSKVTA
jgi:hypothetical protein